LNAGQGPDLSIIAGDRYQAIKFPLFIFRVEIIDVPGSIDSTGYIGDCGLSTSPFNYG